MATNGSSNGNGAPAVGGRSKRLNACRFASVWMRTVPFCPLICLS